MGEREVLGRMNTCMCLCVRACLCVCVCMCVRASMYVYIYACIYCINVCIYMLCV